MMHYAVTHQTAAEIVYDRADADILPDAGPVTHEEAEAKAFGEYEKFRRIQDQTFLSDFDKFIEGLTTDRES